ncbi:MAG: DUF2141 domain-containing protein [Mariprofundaceae bacterium]
MIDQYKPKQWGAMFFQKTLVCILLLTAVPLLSEVVVAAELSIVISGIENSKGVVRAALFNKPDQFPEGEVLIADIQNANNQGVKISFRALPAGDYAVAVLHDENRSGNMDYNWFGFPQEAYGFSGRKVFGKPSFKDSRFHLPEEGKSIFIRVK